MRKLLVSITCLLLVIGIAVAGFSATEESKRGGTLTAAFTASPPTLDPHNTTNTITQQVVSHIFEPLFAFNEDFQVEPVLVSSWEKSEDDLTYTFTLREGVKFHNGDTLTAEDAKASLNRLREMSPISGYYDDVESIEVVDDLTFKVHMSDPSSLMSSLKIQVTWQGIMPKEYAEKREELPAEELVGTGPYELSNWDQGTEIVLTRYEDYKSPEGEPSGFVGEKVPYLDKVVIKPVKEVGTRVAGLQTGKYDYAASLPTTKYDTIESSEGLIPKIVDGKWELVWELNQKEFPTDNVKFRRAILAALDMEEVMSTVAMGNPKFYTVAPGIKFTPGSEWYSEEGSEYYNQANIEKAKELLDEAGYDNEDLTILSNRDYYWMYRATLAAASQLEKAGIRVKLEFYDWNTQIGKALDMEGWNVNQSGWSTTEEPLRMTSSVQCEAPYAYGYCNEEMDKYLDQLGKPMNFEERKKVWDDIQGLFYEDVAAVHFGYLNGLSAIRKDVENYESWFVVPRFWNVWKAN